jgi:acetate---CoA ligase (ADP-forming)
MKESPIAARERYHRLVNPRSIAIVGASASREHVGTAMADTLVASGYTGSLYLVNPNHAEIAGRPCYSSIGELPERPDHCVVSVPARVVPEVIESALQAGVPAATILSSGYGTLSAAEAGERLAAISDRMLVLGPNCLGFANLANRVVATHSPVLMRDLRPGNVALISQSGGLAFSVAPFLAQQRGLRFSHILSVGTAYGIQLTPLIDYIVQSANPKAVIVIAEDGRLASEAISMAGSVPLILLKLGRGEVGSRASRSHTGAIATEYDIIRDCALDAGAAMVDDMEEAMNVAALLCAGVRHSARIAGVSVSGGCNVMFADAVDSAGGDLPMFSTATQETLREIMPDYMDIANPLDLGNWGTSRADRQSTAHEILLTDDETDCLVPIFVSKEDYSQICRDLVRLSDSSAKPICVVWNGGSYEDASAVSLREHGIPVFRSALQFFDALNRIPRVPISPFPAFRESSDTARTDMFRSATPTESESMEFLQDNGLPVPRYERCDVDDLINAARRVGYPVVVKPDVAATHISDAENTVFVDVRNDEEMVALAGKIDYGGAPAIVSAYLPGLEVLVSSFTDPSLGKVMMFGTGGRFADTIRDVRYVRLPTSAAIIERAFAETFVGRLLMSGERNSVGFDECLRYLEKVGELSVASARSVEQIEINPVTVGRHGACAVDVSLALIAARRTPRSTRQLCTRPRARPGTARHSRRRW